jgi:hypothetical protein
LSKRSRLQAETGLRINLAEIFPGIGVKVAVKVVVIVDITTNVVKIALHMAKFVNCATNVITLPLYARRDPDPDPQKKQ